MVTNNETPIKALPYNPIDTVMRSPEHARRTIQGILESYNSNYDALAEAVQNSMDALEDASFKNLPKPYELEITIDLKENAISVFDTGIGMTQDQVCEAFAPSATFKDVAFIIRKRGDKYPYRGYKGVGLSFLAYGTDDIQIQSRQDGTLIRGRMRFGRQWVAGKQALAPLLEIDSQPTPLDGHRRGTYIRVRFSADTRPVSLSHLGSSIEVWEAIVRTRTAAGQIQIGQEPVAPINVHLKLVNKDGLQAEKKINAQFYYPHLVRRNPEFRFLDVGKYYKDHPGIADHSVEARRQDGVYVEWNTNEIRDNLGDKIQEFEGELAEFTPRLYAFRPYHAPVWSDINRSATQQSRTHYFGPGLVIGVNHQRLAEIFRVQASRSELLAQNIFVLVHFEKAKPDQGRKTLQSRVMEVAQIVADGAIQYLLKQSSLLKPAGEKTTAAQRAVEKDHESWVDNVKAHARASPLLVPPVSYASTPITEQDVVGLFHQFSALKIFPGLRVLATSAAHTYDCYAHFECKDDNIESLRYRGIDNNPLGLSTDILAPDETQFSTRGLTIEFKNNLEGLTDDLDNPSRKKAFGHIDICVCWGTIEGYHRWYTMDPITEVNLHERRYPGVTHILRKDGEAHVIQVIMLEEIVRRITAGQIRLSFP